MQASRGDAQFLPATGLLEWRIPTGKDAGTLTGTATLRCSVSGYPSADDDVEDSVGDADEDANANLLQGYYEAPTSYNDATGSTSKKTRSSDPSKRKKKKKKSTKKTSRSAALQPEDAEEDPIAATTPSPNRSIPQTPTPPPQSQSQYNAHLPAFFAPSSTSRPTRRTKAQVNASLMPNSASVSFSVRGWLPSGIKVDSLNIDQRRSRGLGESVKPYKGVKYLCVSNRGVERRC
jgi:hypothetical protein